MNAWRTSIDAKTHTKWLLTACMLSALAAYGMIIAVPDIDTYSITFAFSLSWVTGGFASVFTQRLFLRMCSLVTKNRLSINKKARTPARLGGAPRRNEV